MNYSVGKKLAHLVNGLKFKVGEIEEIRKLYSGEPFNPNDDGIKKLIETSRELCEKFSALGAKRHKTRFGYHIDQIKRIFVLRKLFCGRFMLADVRSGIDLVIGLVDAPSLTFFNYDVHFGAALVTMGRGVEIAPKVKIGNQDSILSYANTGLARTNIGKDAWLGLGAEIRSGANVGDECVIGAGAIVETDIPNRMLAVGRPATIKREINRHEKETRYGKGSPFSQEEESKLLSSVRQWSKMSEVKFHCILSGWQFNLLDAKLMALYNATHAISESLNDVNVTEEQKEDGKNFLFPLKGENFKMGSWVHVDMLGTAKIGNNVTIGDRVIFGGNIILGDNVSIGDDASLFASGHPIYSKRRKMIFSWRHGIVQIGQNDLIIVESGVKIGKNAIITPGSIVTIDVPDGAIYVKNKLV